ncbi:sulfatase-like hydrolase/transferase [Jiangella alba]|uniref:Arylsulfatase A n=1 Tax=Jiangella alba TaxID=561176 RepID=A0A1H5PUT9_9ACTN|nr:sulfatase-like hydrolase/transferase [Jiangella alba]SEF16777.1 Arylsulfatase A [Jiangella alba]
MSGDRPNLVVVTADDLAIWAVGCYGNAEIRTPHIDALARGGTRFTEFYCTSPVCSPSRASLLTGRIPSAHGVHDWIRGGNGHDEPGIGYLDGLTSYPRLLADAGYTCGISGKWHLGDSPVPQQGYQHWFVHPSGGGRYHDAVMYRDGRRVDTEGYLTDVITDDATGFLRARAGDGSPFLLNVNYTAPHSPWVDQHPPDLVDSYADCAFESCPQETRHPWIEQHPIELDNTEQNADPARGPVTVRDHLQGYFAAVTALDQGVGRIVAELRALGLEERTLLLVTSDNGFNCGHHGIWGKGNATFPQNMYDSSVKVPMIASMPGRVPVGEVDAMLSGYDLLPTLLEVARLAERMPSGLPGHSFAAELTGRPAGADRPVVVYDEFGPTRMIRTRNTKYVHRYPYGPHELYDLVRDPDERINLLADERVLDRGEPDRRARAAELRTLLERWFDRYADPRRDGRVQAVTGRGQLRPVGRPGEEAFHPFEARKQLDAAYRDPPP